MDPELEQAKANYTVTLDTAAVFEHELFMSWVRAGFTREEALKLLLQQKEFTYMSGDQDV